MARMYRNECHDESFAVTGPAFGVQTYAALFDGFAKIGTSIGEAYAAVGQEWLSFLSERFQKDLELSQRLAHCTTPEEATREWSKFFGVAAEAYKTEWERLTDIGSATMKEVSGTMERNRSVSARRS